MVIDPGILVAAAISPAGTPANILRAFRVRQFELVVSPALLAELQRVLLRPKFRHYIDEDQAVRYVDNLARSATLLPDAEVQPGVTPDPKDDYLVALARATNAQFLISGDAHLTGLPDPEPPVIAPATFLRLLQD